MVLVLYYTHGSFRGARIQMTNAQIKSVRCYASKALDTDGRMLRKRQKEQSVNEKERRGSCCVKSVNPDAKTHSSRLQDIALWRGCPVPPYGDIPQGCPCPHGGAVRRASRPVGQTRCLLLLLTTRRLGQATGRASVQRRMGA